MDLLNVPLAQILVGVIAMCIAIPLALAILQRLLD